MQLRNKVSTSCAVALLVLASLGVAVDGSAANILVNPGFETGGIGLNGWLVSGQGPNSNVTLYALDNGPSAPGTHTAYFDNFGSAVNLTLEQSTAVGSAMPGQVNVSFDFKSELEEAGAAFFYEVFAEQYGVGVIGGTGQLVVTWPFGGWIVVAGGFTAPAGTDFLTIRFTASTTATSGSGIAAHIDNVVLDQGAAPVAATTWSSIKALYR